MMLSKVWLVTVASSPISPAIAFARSASIPMTVLPSDAMNSSGAYVASAATVSCPLDLMSAGTWPAIAGSGLTLKLAAVSVPPPPPFSSLLLPQPAATVTVAKAITAISAESLCFISLFPPLGIGYGTGP